MVTATMLRPVLRFHAALLLGGLLMLATATQALAHAIPSLTVEAVFNSDRNYVLRVNVDPRLFLSNKPTTLPPVEAAWYTNQSPEQQKATEKQSSDFLASALSLVFTGQTVAPPPITYQPMDGATNLPLGADSKEVHLLAEMRGQVPPAALDFALGVGRDANTSVILINSRDGEQERRPQVLFPGETSRPFDLPGGASHAAPGSASTDSPTSPGAVVTTVEVGEQSRSGPLVAMLCVGVVVAVAFLVKRARARV